MISLQSVLRALQSSRYLDASLATSDASSRVLVEQLLPHGHRYCEQLSAQWQLKQASNITTHFTAQESKHSSTDKTVFCKRLAFIRSPEFRANMQILQKNASPAPVIIKSQLRRSYTTSPDSFIQPLSAAASGNATYLISDYFFNASRGLEKFYNIQRERKIWWMRFSANPSRYFLEPFDLSAEKEQTPGSQSITIKSRFPFGVADMEHVTLVPLRDALFHKDELQHFQLADERSGQSVLPAVIRSVIHLEYAACAMLLDGCDHHRKDTLLLNRKLAPYQCMLACLHRDNALEDLRDLYLHLLFVMRGAGLRIFDDAAQSGFTNSQTRINTEFQAADRIGIPYAILIEEDTLRTGLLKLRNRDTTLEETIHISDIPAYLLNIFAN